MSRSRRAKARSRGGSIPVKPPNSSDSAFSEPALPGRNPAEASVYRFERIDAVLLALILGFALLLIVRTGFASGRELYPMPDAVEYAAIAVNLDRGLGPVLHFGGNSYPPRYTIGYPLILAGAYPLLGHRAERLFLVTALTALVAIAGLYLLTLGAFDRPSAVLAGLLLATSPHFLMLSSCVLSDIPALAVVVLAALAFLYAEEKESIVASALCGLLAGLAVTIRPTNCAILLGMLAAVLLVRPRRLQFARVMALAVGLLAFPGLQAWLNLHYLGSILSNGYVFWQPQFYSSSVFKTFKLSYLVVPALTSHGNGNFVSLAVPALTNYRHGNLVSYAIAMLGLDGILGQLNLGTELGTLGHARYAFYPFPVAVFAGLGMFFAVRGRKRDASTMRAMYLGLGFLASLLLIYLFYFWSDRRFIMPGLFIVFAAAGYGLVSANRRLERGWAGFAVIALDVLLAGAIVVQTVSRPAVALPDSKLVDDVLAMRPRLANAVVVSDISLQWLELIAGGEPTEFVGLNNLSGGQWVNEKHLHWLYDKKSKGWRGPIPPILLADGELDRAEARKLAEEDKKGRPVYLLLLAPTTREWFLELNWESTQIGRYFSLEMIEHYPEVGLYRLKPH
jgi:4-amino-4-deoxy-L-arabinose transferase-like glycosyltransferase